MCIENEVSKLYDLWKTNNQQITDLAVSTMQQFDEIKQIGDLNQATLQQLTNMFVQISAQVQVLREEVLSLNKRFPE